MAVSPSAPPLLDQYGGIDPRELVDLRGQLAAIRRSHAVIEFGLKGTILTANPCFLAAVGYRLDEVQGLHHSMFVEPSQGAGPEYEQFWADLAEGTCRWAEYKMLGKDGKHVWLQGSYNPILDESGTPFKVVSYGVDVTTQKLRSVEVEGWVGAVEGVLAVVAQQLSTKSEEVGLGARFVSGGSEQLNKDVQGVAERAAEMSLRIRELAKRAEAAASLASSAVHGAESTHRALARLDARLLALGKVTRAVSSVAQQTSLLALNATFEAARVGESGKGIQIVAGELKELAKHVAAIAADSGNEVEALQNETKSAASAIAHVRSLTASLEELQTTLAGDAEQQLLAATDIARGSREAARSSAEISASVANVSVAAKACHLRGGAGPTQDMAAGVSDRHTAW